MSSYSSILSFSSNICTSKRQRLMNVFVSNLESASTFPMQAMELQVSSLRRQDHCKNFHIHHLWRCKFANHLRTVPKVLGMQQE
jgi:hypothetical protein